MSQNPISEVSNRDRRRFLRQVRGARDMYIGCLIFIVLIALVWVGLRVFHVGFSLLFNPDHPASLILSQPSEEVFYLSITVTLLTGLTISAFSNRRKTPFISVAILLAVIVIGAPLTYYLSYSRFWAVTPDRGKVELHFLWPRPNQTLNASEVTAVEVESEFRQIKNSASYYISRLRIKMADKSWASEWTRNHTMIDKARDAILKEKEAARHQPIIARHPFTPNPHENLVTGHTIYDGEANCLLSGKERSSPGFPLSLHSPIKSVIIAAGSQ
jgi:hypothetical protein